MNWFTEVTEKITERTEKTCFVAKSSDLSKDFLTVTAHSSPLFAALSSRLLSHRSSHSSFFATSYQPPAISCSFTRHSVTVLSSLFLSHCSSRSSYSPLTIHYSLLFVTVLKSLLLMHFRNDFSGFSNFRKPVRKIKQTCKMHFFVYASGSISREKNSVIPVIGVACG